jgi:hypothetical protein
MIQPVIQPVFSEGEAKRIHQITLENITLAVITAGLATEAEVHALFTEMDNFVENPQTIMSFPRLAFITGQTALYQTLHII